MKSLILLLLLYKTRTISTEEISITKWFEEVNNQLTEHNKDGAEIAWKTSTDPKNPELVEQTENYMKRRILWQRNTCQKMIQLRLNGVLNEDQSRQMYLLCRGPVYTFEEAREINNLSQELQSIYSEAEVCFPTSKQVNNVTSIETTILDYLTSVKQYLKVENRYDDITQLAVHLILKEEKMDRTYCLQGEVDFEDLMKFSRNEEILKLIWTLWREKLGPPMKRPYLQLVKIENVAARRNGYTDIGSAWRDELEIPNLRQLSRILYNSIRPFYKLIHGIVRFYLRKLHGNIVPEYGPIPAHLLGDLWSQNWESLSDLIIPNMINIDESIQSMNWTVKDMAGFSNIQYSNIYVIHCCKNPKVKKSEDYYQSFGLPPMTEAFWTKSVFTKKNDDTRCHGSAADMFQGGDFRLLYCSGTSAEDFYVIHHEMGHIQYFMAYETQPGIFRQGPNSALHESIGDAIMYGVMAPQHLHRLGLINDTILYETKDKIKPKHNNKEEKVIKTKQIPKFNEDENAEHNDAPTKFTSDDLILLKQALNKIPQIPFSLAVDEYRWRLFEGKIDENRLNKDFWRLILELQGIAPTNTRSEDYFDIGAKYHVPDNTPYIRYFLSSFLQHQIFEELCHSAVFGRRNVTEDIPKSIPLHRCDIYGSKPVGKLLRDIMSRGSSQHWRQVLQETIRVNTVSAKSLLKYYKPLIKTLKDIVKTHRIPIGW